MSGPPAGHACRRKPGWRAAARSGVSGLVTGPTQGWRFPNVLLQPWWPDRLTQQVSTSSCCRLLLVMPQGTANATAAKPTLGPIAGSATACEWLVLCCGEACKLEMANLSHLIFEATQGDLVVHFFALCILPVDATLESCVVSVRLSAALARPSSPAPDSQQNLARTLAYSHLVCQPRYSFAVSVAAILTTLTLRPVFERHRRQPAGMQ